jgi:hypothetical protein
MPPGPLLRTFPKDPELSNVVMFYLQGREGNVFSTGHIAPLHKTRLVRVRKRKWVLGRCSAILSFASTIPESCF